MKSKNNSFIFQETCTIISIALGQKENFNKDDINPGGIVFQPPNDREETAEDFGDEERTFWSRSFKFGARKVRSL